MVEVEASTPDLNDKASSPHHTMTMVSILNFHLSFELYIVPHFVVLQLIFDFFVFAEVKHPLIIHQSFHDHLVLFQFLASSFSVCAFVLN